MCIQQISWSRVLEKYQGKGYSQSFNQALYTGRSPKFYPVWARFQCCLAYFNTSCSHTVNGNRMSPSKSKSSRKMAPGTEEHDEDLLFRIGKRVSIYDCLLQVSQYRSPYDSVHSSLYLGTLWEDLLNCLKRSYHLAALSLWISYGMFQIFAVSV